MTADREPSTEALSAEGPAAQRLEAFLEGLPRNAARTQALIDFGTVLRDANAAMLATLDREREERSDLARQVAAGLEGVETRHRQGDWTEDGFIGNSVDGSECNGCGEMWPCSAQRLRLAIFAGTDATPTITLADGTPEDEHDDARDWFGTDATPEPER